MGRKSITQKNIEDAKARFEERRARFCAKYPEYKIEDINNVDDLLPLEEEKRQEERALEALRAEEKAKKKAEECKSLMAVQWDAHSLYMNYASLPKIHALTGIPMPDLQRMVYEEGGWKSQREEIKKDVKEAVKQQAIRKLRDVVTLGIDIIKDSLEEFKATLDVANRKATIFEADTISKIFQKLHRAKLLEEEGEDPQFKQKSMSPQELLTALSGDAYLRAAILDAGEVHEAEFSVIEDEDGKAHDDSLATTDGRPPSSVC